MTEKWGLGPERLHELNPALVILRVTHTAAVRSSVRTERVRPTRDRPGPPRQPSPSSAPGNTYATRDGHWVAISASATSIAERVMRLVGRPDIAEQPRFHSARERVRHGDQLDGIEAAWIRSRDYEHVMAAFERLGLDPARVAQLRAGGRSDTPSYLSAPGHNAKLLDRVFEADADAVIADWVPDHLEPKGVGVVLEAEHPCMSLRGVQKLGARTVTSSIHGLIRDGPRTRQEFLALTTRSDS